MNTSVENIKKNIPSTIRVKVTRGKSQCYLIELPEYDVFTEADTLQGIFLQANDLIYTFFEIPKKYQKDIIFFPSKIKERKVETKQLRSSYLTNYKRFYSCA